MELRWYQSECVSSFYDYFTRYNGNPVAALPTGCHAKGQGVLMFNGSVKRVEDVVVGDLLMGPDSTPRTVTALCRGRQEMRRIVPTKGEPWVVNKDHILSLYRTSQNSEPKYECELPGVIEETVSQWEASSKTHKHIHKLYRVGVEFPPAKPVSLDPYFLGLFLGDGGCSQGSTGFTTADEVIYKWVTGYIAALGDSWRISHNGSKAITLYPTTGQKRHRMRIPQTTKLLKHLGLRHVACGDKFIPNNYKVGSRETRLKVLAGLLDTDGHLTCNGYDFISKSHRLASDTTFVARSLGYAAYVTPCVKKSQLGTAGDYFRVSISGDLQELPLLLAYKKAQPRRQKKNVLVTGFKTETLPEADYYGFSLDGDCLYLLDDFTVTHNTGKSIVIAEFLRSMFAQWPFQRIIMATHVKELIRQNHDELLALWPQAPVGIFSAGLGQKNVRPITFGGIKSMVGKAELFGHVDLVLIDECHLVGPADDTSYHTFITDLKAINPRLKVVGLTATPYRLGQGLLTDVAHDREGNPMPPIFTDICYNITGRDSFNRLIAEGYLAPLVPKQTGTKLDVSNVAIRGGEFVAGELQKAVDREEITFAAIEETVQLGADRKHWLIFGTGETHCQHIVNALDSLGIPAAMVTSRTSDTDRDKHVADFKAGRIRALVNNNIFTAGFNFRPIDLICVLRPTTSPGLWVQMLGRGTRPADGKENCIAEGSLVLTDAGLVPIESVTLDMRVWDGTEFVPHMGSVCRGEQTVITYAGLTATEDHRVWTQEGWKTFGQCAAEQIAIAQTGFGEQTVSLSSGYFVRNTPQREKQSGVFENALRKVLSRIRNGLQQFASRCGWLPNLRKPACSTKVVVQSGERCKTTLHEQIRSCVGTIWRAWHSFPVFFSVGNGAVCTRNVGIEPFVGDRSNRQRRALRSGKFAAIDWLAKPFAYATPTRECCRTRLQKEVPKNTVCRFYFARILFKRNDVCPNRTPLAYAVIKTQRRVWDILNAGRLHRFTVSNLLVSNCLVLDFAGNTRRLGPINDPVLPKKRRKGVATEEREAPVKLCPHCATWNHSSVRVCTNCKEEFPPPETKLQASAGTDALIVGAAPTLDVIEVDRVEYRKHVPHYLSGKPPTFKVEYHCGLRVFGEWICFDHEGFPRKKARDWWRNATDDYDHEPPESVDEAMGRIQELRPATHLRVWVNTPKPRVMACDYSGTAFGTRSINL